MEDHLYSRGALYLDTEQHHNNSGVSKYGQLKIRGSSVILQTLPMEMHIQNCRESNAEQQNIIQVRR